MNLGEPASLAALTAALGAGAAVTWLAWRAGVLDMPNARSSHSRPTPRSGGLGIAAGLGAGVLAALLFGGQPSPALSAVLAGAGACAALGLADDLFETPPLVKLGLLGFVSVFMTAMIGPVTSLPLGGGLAIPAPGLIGLCGSALFVFVVINAANFMDGADGMLVAGLFPPALGLAVLLPEGSGLGPAALALAASLAAFLAFNRPPAKVFAGDAGSLAAGAAIGGLSLAHAGQGPQGAVWLAPLLLLPFIGDVLLTLLKRARGGRLSLSAHREHAYQVLLQAGSSHAAVSRLWLLLAATATVFCISLTLTDRGPAMFLGGFAIAAAGWLAFYARIHRTSA